jgi:hypothetical protein
MSTQRPEKSEAPLPMRRPNPPINPAGKPTTATLLTLVVIGVGFLIGMAAPSLIVSPMQRTATLNAILTAFGFTLLGAGIALVAGLLAFRRDRNWAWLIITGVPTVVLVTGGAVLAATKVIT